MMIIRSPHPTSRRRHSAFTLVEIMVAIVIIAILMSLLLPALGRVRTTARIQEVKTDMDKLTTAITQFKTRFNVDVPGSITLYEQGSAWSNQADPEALRSRGIIRQIWPLFSFGNIDLDGDGILGEATVSKQLDGAECLVFFLGGRRDSGSGSSNSNAMIGFSKNPTNPFAFGGNREGPFFEFRNERLIDFDNDAYPEYLDPIPGQQAPYVYFSPGYRVAAEPSLVWVNIDNYYGGNQRLARAYYQAISVDPANPGVTTVSLGAQSTAHNKSSFQIISPGFDYQYGIGGVFNPGSPSTEEDVNNNGVLDTSEDKNGNGVRDLVDADKDNITNFHSGLLIE